MAKTPTTEAKVAPDWERIEADYRCGIQSLREIAGNHGVSHTAIRKRAEREGWEKDLTAKVRAKADALVSKAVVSKEVSTETKITEAIAVGVQAQKSADAQLGHIATATQGQRLVTTLLAELAIQTDNIADFERLGELLDQTSVDDSGRVKEDKLNKIYRAVISMAGRVDNLKKLGESFERFWKVERVIHKMDAPGEGPTDPANESPNQLARRVAFILAQGMKQTGA